MFRKISLFLVSLGLVALPLAPVSAQRFLDQAVLDAEKVATGAGYAATSEDQTQADLIDTVVNIIKIILTFLGTVLTLIILWAGWKYMTAGGDSAQIDEAKAWLKNAVIGLIIVISAYSISSFALKSAIDTVFK
ncbi:MAG: Uncharacterized protein G01um101418_323 [Parcubacteria group bacterium Gr01-1014_18]|nr:MAG: Uncharacterized protein Greene041636_301 [Parcubacteria group bacterium Greene0416_36]TSC81183.1 MAG: Uncharacterized protein G01um101418_323 [Parcubacteria group bacterium Gr01-1014_18]TSC99180.1 MAG: Uncharacterized protein Greene101420_325 [Parcubacteria group bacterium Greene1014_20]TSD07462.1 MAG: Uncharacterized protein Greene07142_161 [Parcubacteria group bacterium Greene0714_2]